MKFPIAFFFSFLPFLFLSAQVIKKPIAQTKSHKTLDIWQIEITENNTIVYLSVENKRTDGEAWFCADNNISIKNANGEEEYSLIKAESIPICPDAHKFTRAGEKLNFKLLFPKLSPEISEIHLMENCEENCFYFLGIIVNEELNKMTRVFEQAVELFRNEQKELALKEFLKISNSDISINSRIFSYSMYIIPVIYYQIEQIEDAKSWYYKIKNSEMADKLSLLEKLNEIEFFTGIE
ncbi:MAG: hypothetical protein GY705_15990 [Bacteroidetes bacterium]|nr:hypothetical protein [Bacteroidota bacterium]